MSQVQDYTKYQTDLQQCEGLAVQNQPSAPQRDSVAGTAVKGAAVGAAAGAVSGGSGYPLPGSSLAGRRASTDLDGVLTRGGGCRERRDDEPCTRIDEEPDE